MTIQQHIIQTQERINRLRQLLNMLQNPIVTLHYNSTIDPLIENCDIEGLRRWILNQRNSELETMTSVRLRQLAKRNRVPRYNYLDKDELIDALRTINSVRIRDLCSTENSEPNSCELGVKESRS